MLYLEGCHGNLPIEHTSRRICGLWNWYGTFSRFFVCLFEITHKKDRLEPLSSVVNLTNEVSNYTPNCLDSLSTYNKLLQVEGNRTVAHDVICYSLRSVMEICLYPLIPKPTHLKTVYIIVKPPAARSYPLPIHAAGHPRLHGISAPIAFRSWLAILWMVAPQQQTPRYSMPSSGVFLCLDSVSTTVKMTAVMWNRTVEQEIACYSQRDVMESRHLLRGVFSTPQISDQLEQYWSVPILTTVEPLPVWMWNAAPSDSGNFRHQTVSTV